MRAKTTLGYMVKLYTSSMGEPMLDWDDAKRMVPDASLSVDQRLYRAAGMLVGYSFKGYSTGSAYLTRN